MAAGRLTRATRSADERVKRSLGDPRPLVAGVFGSVWCTNGGRAGARAGQAKKRTQRAARPVSAASLAAASGREQREGGARELGLRDEAARAAMLEVRRVVAG